MSETKQDPNAELFGEFGGRLRGDRWQPDVDVFETDSNIVVRAEIAGVRSQDEQYGVGRRQHFVGEFRLAADRVQTGGVEDAQPLSQ